MFLSPWGQVIGKASWEIYKSTHRGVGLVGWVGRGEWGGAMGAYPNRSGPIPTNRHLSQPPEHKLKNSGSIPTSA